MGIDVALLGLGHDVESSLSTVIRESAGYTLSHAVPL
jgi:hypothetical protein